MPGQIYKLINDGRSGWRCVKAEDAPVPEGQLHVIDDTMEPLEHPCDGKFYTSKREFLEVTRAHGCEEVGERPQDRRERSIDYRGRRDELFKAFSRAYDDLSANKGPEWQKILQEMPKAKTE